MGKSPSRNCKLPCGIPSVPALGTTPHSRLGSNSAGAPIVEATRHCLLLAKYLSAILFSVGTFSFLLRLGYLPPQSLNLKYPISLYPTQLTEAHDRMILRIHMVHVVFDITLSKNWLTLAEPPLSSG